MKSLKVVISLVAALVAVSAAIAAIVIYQEELQKLYQDCASYCRKTLGGKKDEYADFADVE
ncbi:MAG: hypothetical protein FWE28_10100 [Oscillospiraceae bacterium]|nr:hypothetical protein [Oscillospiraceae bacterium]